MPYLLCLSNLDLSRNLQSRLLSCKGFRVTLRVIPSVHHISSHSVTPGKTVQFSVSPFHYVYNRNWIARFAKVYVKILCLQFWYRSFKSILSSQSEEEEHEHQVNWIMLSSKHNLSANAPVFSGHSDILLFSYIRSLSKFNWHYNFIPLVVLFS